MSAQNRLQFGLIASVLALSTSQASAQPQQLAPAKAVGTIRVASYNVSFNRKMAGELTRDLRDRHPQVIEIAAIIRALQPDILLLNEIDFSSEEDHAALFADQHLADQNTDLLGHSAWPMPHRFSAPVNTGVASGLDLNQDHQLGSPEDAWGFGVFPGQYGMAILSRYEIDRSEIRTFQNFLWSSMPGALRPRALGSPEFYTEEVWKKLRLSSKSFWDVPIQTPHGKVHILSSHPTPPAFDGPEDRNGCRNHDEIRMISDYISTDQSSYLVDDRGGRGGIAATSKFVIVGDLNADPVDGNSRSQAIRRILAHPLVQSAPTPTSRGAVSAAQQQRGANEHHHGKPETDTADFSDQVVGNLRADYVLPSQHFKIINTGVVWPHREDFDPAVFPRIQDAIHATDHRLVWIDVGAKL